MTKEQLLEQARTHQELELKFLNEALREEKKFKKPEIKTGIAAAKRLARLKAIL